MKHNINIYNISGCLLVDPESDHAKRGAEFYPLSLEDFDSLPSPRVIKTHAPSHMVPGDCLNGQSSEANFIVVVRNPKDVLTSCYYHPHPNNCPHSKKWPFDAWAKVFLEGLVPSGSWNEWIKGWKDKELKLNNNIEKDNDGKMNKKVLFIKYEDLTSKNDELRLETFRILGRYLLNISMNNSLDSASVLPDINSSEFELLVQRVDSLCKFDTMKKQSGDAHHMRQGKSGNWKEHFTPLLAKHFDLMTEEQARHCGVFDLKRTNSE